MEWVETTGRTIEEAKDAGLDQLGVDEQDAEFEIVEEPKSGLFGRVRQEARVRTRVRPAVPRPKVERRDRRRRPKGDGPTEDRARQGERPVSEPSVPSPAPDQSGKGEGEGVGEAAEVAKSFLEGVVRAFGCEGAVEMSPVDEETVDARVSGEGLGLLIGPRGQTLQALEELTRTVVGRWPGRWARVRVDVAGYRQRRWEALARFTEQVARQVVASGVATSLEPMSAADRKVVHDVGNTIDGVATRSEGVEPQRRVVIVPEPE